MPFQQGQTVLVDTNVVLEAHRVGCWIPLANYFQLRTVGMVIEETQTGFQNRSPEQTIRQAELVASLAQVDEISEIQRVDFNLRHGHPTLDAGERDLLILAETLGNNAWLLNSPDMAAVRFAHVQGWLDRLVSLEAMNRHIKGRLGSDLQYNYTERWLSGKKTDLLLSK